MLSVVGALAAAIAANDGGAPPPVPACVQVSTEARWVPYGYNHLVFLRNGCSRPVSCTVSTDVNPQPHVAEVPAGGTAEIATYLGAAAASFVARVACRVR